MQPTVGVNLRVLRLSVFPRRGHLGFRCHQLRVDPLDCANYCMTWIFPMPLVAPQIVFHSPCGSVISCPVTADNSNDGWRPAGVGWYGRSCSAVMFAGWRPAAGHARLCQAAGGGGGRRPAYGLKTNVNYVVIHSMWIPSYCKLS